MDSAEMVARWLAALGSRVGADLSLDTSGVCAISCAPGVILVVEVPKDRDLVLIMAALGPVPDDPDARYGLYRELLRQNLWQPLASGGHFALDDEAGLLMLCYSASIAGLDSDRFQALLEQACGAVVAVRKQLGLQEMSDSAARQPEMMRV